MARKPGNRRRETLVLFLLGIVPVVWLALLIAPCLSGGIPEIVRSFGRIMRDPLHIELCEDSLKTVLFSLLLYGVAAGVVLSSDRNYRRREEHGSARWGSPAKIRRKYADAQPSANILLTQHTALSLESRRHRRNLNVLVCGGSGSGKTRYYAKPNLLQANSSLVILDPKIAVF